MKIFLFDFDGVINDILPIAVETYNMLFRKYKIKKTFTPKSFTILFLNNFHSELAKVVPDEEVRHKILNERAQEYIRRKKDFNVFPGIKIVLEKLSMNGIIKIISSNQSNFIKELLEHKKITCVSEVLGEDVGKSKVKKILFQKSLYPNERIYFIGDTTGDLREGKEAGVLTVAITWGFHSKKLLEKEHPDFLFNKPKDLLHLLEF